MEGGEKCCVPGCGWKEGSDKYLVFVPTNRSRRKRWLDAINISAGANQRLFCCEDHFVLSEDAENFIKVKLMGGRLLMKPGVVPHKNLGNGCGGSDSGEATPERSQLENFDVDIGLTERIKTEPEEAHSHFLLGSSFPDSSQLENVDLTLPSEEEEPENHSHFLLGSTFPDGSNLENSEWTSPIQVCIEETRAAPSAEEETQPSGDVNRRVTRRMRQRKYAEPEVKMAALGRQRKSSVRRPKRHKPRILRRRKSSESSNSEESLAVTEDDTVVLVEYRPSDPSEAENIVVDVDLTPVPCPCTFGREDDHDEDDPPPVYNAPRPPDPPKIRPKPPTVPHPASAKSIGDGVMQTYGTCDERGNIVPLVVAKKKPPKYIDYNELSEEEHCVMPSSSEDEFSSGEFSADETEEEVTGSSLLDICDADDVDWDVHRCIRLSEKCLGKKRKANDVTEGTDCKRLKNGLGGCGSDLVAIDCETVNGETKDGGVFVWHSQPCSEFIVEAADITPGPVERAREAEDPVTCFLLFFTEEMMQSMIPGTNAKIASYKVRQGSQSRTYAEVESMDEIKLVIGLLVYAAAKRDTHLPLSAMFDAGSSGARYRSMTSPQRLRLLLQCLRFGKPASGKLAPVSDLWESLLRHCRSHYRPNRHVTIGNRIVKSGKSPFKLSTIPERYALRKTLMVDSSTKYVVDAVIGESSLTETALKLTESIKSTYRTITFENTVGIPVISELRRCGLTAVGILDQNEPELPRDFLDPHFKDRQIRSSLYIYHEDLTAVSYKRKPGAVVCYVSSSPRDLGLNNTKPEVITSYESNSRCVREWNKVVDSVNCARRSKRWTLTFFYEVLNIACANAYVVYLHNFYRRCDGTPLSRFDFLTKLADGLTKEFVVQRLTKYRSLTGDLVDQTQHCLLALWGDKGNSRTLAGVAESACKCFLCPEDVRAGRKTCVPCGNCKKTVCRDHLSRFCSKCLIRC